MQTKKENCLVQTNVIFNEEVEMKDYKLEQLDENYGSLVEEILCEVFHIEDQDDSLESMHEAAIYDLRSDSELEISKERELRSLDGDSAPTEDLKLLEEQATSYFKNPTKVFTPSEDVITDDVITGFIQINAGLKFDKDGKPIEIWKSYGQKLVVSLDRLYNPESINSQVESLGFELSDMVRVVFYGAPLSKIVGSREYVKGEKKTLEPLSDIYSNILLAIPAEERGGTDDSIFSFVDRLVKDSIQTGAELGLDRCTIGHWEMTRIRLDELKQEEVELKELRRIEKIQAGFSQRRKSYVDNFKEAKQVIKGLNDMSLKVRDLVDVDSKLIYQLQ